jgi:hypothetical protein
MKRARIKFWSSIDEVFLKYRKPNAITNEMNPTKVAVVHIASPMPILANIHDVTA